MTQFNSTLTQFAAPVGRILFSLLFILAGFDKITGYQGTQGYMEMFGIPGALLPAVILLEIGGGLAILAGYKVRLIAPLMAGFTLMAAFVFHSDFADQMQSILFMKNIAIAGALIFMFSTGAGAYALDNKTVGKAE